MEKAEKSAVSRERLVKAAGLILVAAAAVIPFLPAIKGVFVFDDLNTLVQNPAVKSISPIEFFKDPACFSVKPGNWPYRPLLLLVNSMQFAVVGYNVVSWHLFQYLVHALNSVLVTVLAIRVFRLDRGAFIAGLLFACAPVQSQAVTYVSARSMVISCAPALLSILCIAAAAGSEGRKAALLSALGVLLACTAFFSYEGSLALLAFLPLSLYASGAGFRKKSAWIPLAAMALAGALYLSLRYALAPEWSSQWTGLSMFEHVAVQLRFPFIMARLLALPVHVSFFHHAPAPDSFGDILAIAPAAGLVAVLALLVVFRGARVPASGVAWYFAGTLPSVLVSLNVAWAEHRAYLALAGLAMAAGWCLERLFYAADQKGRRGLYARALVAAALALMCAFTWSRSMEWSWPPYLFRDAASKAPGHYAPWNLLAVEMMKRPDCREAVRYLDIATSINPSFSDAYNSKAYCLLREQKIERAVQAGLKSVKLDPDNATYWSTLGVGYMMQEDWERAEHALKRALDLVSDKDPNRPVIERNWRKLKRKMEEEF